MGQKFGRHLVLDRLRATMTAGSILWYCVCVLYQIFVYGDTLVASLLWKFTVLGCLLPWIVFALNAMASRRLRSLSPRGLISILLFLAVGLLVSITLAPQLGYWAFAQRYDIVYFDMFAFAFPSGMILLLSLTAMVVAFNVRISVRNRDTEAMVRNSKYGLELAVQNIAVYSSIVFWSNFIQQQLLRSSNQYAAFSILMILIMLVPVLQPKLAGLTKRQKKVLGVAGISTTLSLLACLNFVFDIPTWPPSLSFAVFAFLLVCMSAALGFLGALGIDRRSLRYEVTKSLVALSASSGLSMILVYATWFYSHAAVTVTLFQNITIG